MHERRLQVERVMELLMSPYNHQLPHVVGD